MESTFIGEGVSAGSSDGSSDGVEHVNSRPLTDNTGETALSTTSLFFGVHQSDLTTLSPQSAGTIAASRSTGARRRAPVVHSPWCNQCKRKKSASDAHREKCYSCRHAGAQGATIDVPSASTIIVPASEPVTAVVAPAPPLGGYIKARSLGAVLRRDRDETLVVGIFLAEYPPPSTSATMTSALHFIRLSHSSGAMFLLSPFYWYTVRLVPCASTSSFVDEKTLVHWEAWEEIYGGGGAHIAQKNSPLPFLLATTSYFVDSPEVKLEPIPGDDGIYFSGMMGERQCCLPLLTSGLLADIVHASECWNKAWLKMRSAKKPNAFSSERPAISLAQVGRYWVAAARVMSKAGVQNGGLTAVVGAVRGDQLHWQSGWLTAGVDYFDVQPLFRDDLVSYETIAKDMVDPVRRTVGMYTRTTLLELLQAINVVTVGQPDSVTRLGKMIFHYQILSNETKKYRLAKIIGWDALRLVQFAAFINCFQMNSTLHCSSTKRVRLTKSLASKFSAKLGLGFAAGSEESLAHQFQSWAKACGGYDIDWKLRKTPAREQLSETPLATSNKRNRDSENEESDDRQAAKRARLADDPNDRSYNGPGQEGDNGVYYIKLHPLADIPFTGDKMLRIDAFFRHLDQQREELFPAATNAAAPDVTSHGNDSIRISEVLRSVSMLRRANQPVDIVRAYRHSKFSNDAIMTALAVLHVLVTDEQAPHSSLPSSSLLVIKDKPDRSDICGGLWSLLEYMNEHLILRDGESEAFIAAKAARDCILRGQMPASDLFSRHREEILTFLEAGLPRSH